MTHDWIIDEIVSSWLQPANLGHTNVFMICGRCNNCKIFSYIYKKYNGEIAYAYGLSSLSIVRNICPETCEEVKFNFLLK